MIQIDMMCGAKIARENRGLLDRGMRDHLHSCDECKRQLIESFVQDAGPDMEESDE